MVKIGIVGGTGYTGVELLRLLASASGGGRARDHVAQGRRHARRRHVPEPAPALRQARMFTDPVHADLKACDVVFFATPHGVAMAQARELVDAGVKIIDLAADFRLARRRDVRAAGTRCRTRAPISSPNRSTACPKCNREAIRRARIVGNPGCYPTSVQLGFLPLVEAGLVDTEHLIADCKSGVSGAGRKGRDRTCCCRRRPTTSPRTASKAIAIMPEIVQGSTRAQQDAGEARVHAAPGADDPRHPRDAVRAARRTDVDLQALYEKRYAGEPFVDVMPPGSTPDTRSVRASNVAAHRRPSSAGQPIIVTRARRHRQPRQGRRRARRSRT